MPDDTYNPEQAAAAIGNVSASTIRNWCKVYATLLSAGANPPTGTERRLTQQDVAILQQVKVLRDNRRSVEEIIATLQQTATPPPLTVETSLAPSTTAQEAPEVPALLTVAIHSMEKRQDATDARIEATDKRIDQLQQTIAMLEQRQAARVNSLVTGIVLGGGAVLILVALVLAMGR